MTAENIKKLQTVIKNASNTMETINAVDSFRQYIDAVANAKRNNVDLD